MFRAMVCAVFMLFAVEVSADIAHARIDIGVGVTGDSTRVPVYITFPNTGSGEWGPTFWQIVFDLGGAEFLDFEPYPDSGILINPSPPCGGVLVQRGWPCSMQGLVGHLVLRSAVPETLRVHEVANCGGRWYTQVFSSGPPPCSDDLGHYFLSNIIWDPGYLRDPVDVPVEGLTWTLVKELYR